MPREGARLYAGIDRKGHFCKHDHRLVKAAAQCSLEVGGTGTIGVYYFAEGEWWVGTPTRDEQIEARRAANLEVPYPELRAVLEALPARTIEAVCEVPRMRAFNLRLGRVRLRRAERDALVRARLVSAGDIPASAVKGRQCAPK